MHEWRDHDLFVAGSTCSGSDRSRRRKQLQPSCDGLARQRAEVRAGGDYDEADRLRQEIEAAGWEVRDVPGDPGFQLVPKT